MKIDLHVHSKHSTRPSQWFLQKLGCPESFTEPRKLYEIAKSRGMDLVTITDHNTIAGALEIAHLPGTFVSEEVTTYFPEDGCKAHVLVLDIDEAIHQDIQKVRENIHDLVAYLRGEGIVHVLAHPLFGVNDKLTPWHFERMLLLFETFELNGTRDAYQNDTLRSLLTGLTRKDMERLADRHGLEPVGATPWVKGLTGGSDDHSSLGIASMHTHVPDAKGLPAFLESVAQGRARPAGRTSSPKAMAHNLYAIAYQFYKARFGLERTVDKDVLLTFLDRFLSGDPGRRAGVVFRLQALWTAVKRSRRAPASGSLPDMLRHEAERLIHEDKALFAMAKSGTAPGAAPRSGEHAGASLEDEWFRFVTRASDKVLAGFGDRLLRQLSGANLFDVFNGLGAAGALYTALAPYFVAYTVFTKDRALCRQAHAALRGGTEGQNVKVGHFTDTFHDVNGVALTLRMQVDMALKHGKELRVITCSRQDGADIEGVRQFAPIGSCELAEYPGQTFHYPPFLEMLEYVHEQGFTHLHSATPGPIGLAALGIARILKLPVYGTYHTAFPQYAKALTGDDAMEELMWKYMLWYYNQMDKVFVPSKATGDELAAKGIERRKITLFTRGVDIERFTPAKRDGILERWGVRKGPALLYVGRISREKNLHLLAEAFLELRRTLPEANLVVAGDGPYAREMKQGLEGKGAVFTGYIQGDDLARLYASCDLFVFPSATDTFGNVVLEAQASGLPVVVGAQGGPRENVEDGVTGVVAPRGDAQSLCRAMAELLRDEPRRKRMSRAARAAMEERSFDKAFMETWELYRCAC
ncbi:Alpha-monoglucosyldiacylglycerol synthase [Fundidesulfovibrio magnetotacticus]|uniref:Alpha-monoglucosyldiacylglycerol synthase n=1 Tax=Fundidesulfovibrio magnetotacticus TaxID=2730080 RepID=A0A6V8LQE7_9BACT|nr:glycosyltransferase [Fundidesulfovibrio magnetotacticus]GFK92781.1 Alpha-monoglucosyldiacylglycerol synthase [Fundidesulfovibrio magnetotacticus]